MTNVVKKRNPSARRFAAKLGQPGKVALTTALACVAVVASAQETPPVEIPPPLEPARYFTDGTETNFPFKADQGLPCAVKPEGAPNSWLPGCFSSFLLISDVDGDDDKDVLFANGGGYYAEGFSEESTVLFNDGTGGFQNVVGTVFGGASSRLRQVSVGDIDNDGDRDIYQPGGYGLDADKLWVQQDDGTFVDKAAILLPGKMKSFAGASHFGDLDNDGDLDLVVADWGVIPLTGQRASPGNTWVFLNDGTGAFSQLPTNVVPPPMRSVQNLGADGRVDPTDRGWGRTPIDIDLHDIDGDFDLDILVNHRNGQSRIFLNDGTAHFDDFTTSVSAEGETILNYPIKFGPYVYNQELCDFDQDGDLDMFLDNAGPKPAGVTPPPAGNFTQVLVNDGTGHFTDESNARLFNEPYADRADDNGVKCADFNGDGYYDLFVAALQTPGEKVFINDGTGHWNWVPDALPSYLKNNNGTPDDDSTLAQDIADLDGDGLLDVVTGQGESGKSFVDRVYFGSDNSKPDTIPPAFRAVEEVVAVADEPTVIRFALRDRVTSETGEHVKSVTFSYNTGDDSETLPATFVGSDMFRAVIPAQPAGTTIELTLEATDYADLKVTKTIELVIPAIEETSPDAGVTPDASVPMGDGDGDAPMGDGDGDGDGDGEEPLPTVDGGISCPTPDAGPDNDESSDDCSVSSPGLGGHGNLMAGLIVGLAMMLRSRSVRRRARAKR